MLLTFANSDPFAIGVTDYLYQPTSRETDNRIILQIEIEDVSTLAILDTGAPYVVCTPDIAKAIGIQNEPGRESKKLLIRGITIAGQLHRLRLAFIATEGQSLDVSAAKPTGPPLKEPLKPYSTSSKISVKKKIAPPAKD